MKPRTVDEYLENGCGRCPLGGTPDCKVHRWKKELGMLRAIAVGCGLHEEVKWGVPCYTLNNKNIVLLGGFKENCVLSFFKGALLRDEMEILEKPGENTQAARVVRFTCFQQILEQEEVLRNYIFEAMEAEKAGLKVDLKKTGEHEVPKEFAEVLASDSGLNAAFKKLSPGKQRAYLLHFSQAKQSNTRVERIRKCIPKILAGKGFADR